MKYQILACAYALSVFFNDPATTEIDTLSLHDALPILQADVLEPGVVLIGEEVRQPVVRLARPEHRAPRRRSLVERGDRKSTRLNSSHANISYAVFCLKKKKKFMTLMKEQHTKV